eukprot:TRINITY_DN41371_c0_g1_i1.p1 TRINITY_DN41371_c0_g1~~TRINITY_DN41371_c0_g1_i1.p1  ORF type:complete len:360 (+),score=45.08 TRINITY_DN41371_c0_g1_i1:215-1294(+)
MSVPSSHGSLGFAPSATESAGAGDSRISVGHPTRRTMLCQRLVDIDRLDALLVEIRQAALNAFANNGGGGGTAIFEVTWEFNDRETDRVVGGSCADTAKSDEELASSSAPDPISQLLPSGPRVCILGGTAFKDPANEVFVKALGQAFAEKLTDRVVVLTGGMAGVQRTFATTLGNAFPALVHLLPIGQASHFGVGKDINAGGTLEERMAIFAQIGDIYITVEGGPGVAKEAAAAFKRNALVLPVMSTGGASSGMFDFPTNAFERPAFATEHQWACLREKRPPKIAAEALVDIITQYLSKSQPKNLLTSQASQVGISPSSTTGLATFSQQEKVQVKDAKATVKAIEEYGGVLVDPLMQLD